MTPQTAPHTRPPRADGPAQAPDLADWRRPHPLTVAATAISMAVLLWGSMLVAAVAVAFSGALLVAGLLALGGFVAAAAVTGAEWFLVAHTRYRVTEEKVELRSRLFAEKHRTISRDRVRSVDVSADIWTRLVGLRTVTVGTGQNVSSAQGDELKLSLVTAAEADRLRRELLRRAPVTASVADTEREVADARADLDEAIARLDPRWLGAAPLSVFTPILGVAAVGTVYKVVDWFGHELAWRATVDAYELVMAAALVAVPLVAIGVLLVGAIAATALEAEAWWNYRLDREPGGTLRVRRGLLNTKSVSLEERRLRGVELRRRLITRWLRFAQVKAVATGLGTKEHNEVAAKSDLGPEMPEAEAHRIVAAVLGEARSPVRAPRLNAHPRAALRRRVTRAVLGWALLCALTAVPVVGFGWIPWWVLPLPLALLPLALLYAFDLYRGLGSGLSGRYLVLRRGSMARRTVALRTDGVIGWSVTRSPLQRGAGLATIGATTAAGAGVYRAPDMDLAEGLALAEESVPGLLTPFLQRA